VIAGFQKAEMHVVITVEPSLVLDWWKWRGKVRGMVRYHGSVTLAGTLEDLLFGLIDTILTIVVSPLFSLWGCVYAYGSVSVFSLVRIADL
jgi:hypothetical protein